MDTFDGFSPEYDNPMKINDVKKLFTKMGCNVTFAGKIEIDTNQFSAVVKAINVAKNIDYYCFSFDNFGDLHKNKYENVPSLCEKFKIKKNLINPIYLS